jgi:hypothetical protein
VDRCIDQLRGIQETLVIYTNGVSERVLSERNPLQDQLFRALGSGALAERWGNTILPAE